MRIHIPADLPTSPADAYRLGYSNALAKFRSKGGKARADSLTPERRREIGRKAIAARWSKASAGRATS